MRTVYSHSWYRPGNWALPAWWTSDAPVRDAPASFDDNNTFFNGPFVRNVLGHKGGMTTLPKTESK